MDRFSSSFYVICIMSIAAVLFGFGVSLHCAILRDDTFIGLTLLRK
jgi:hypothetical protein